MNIRKRMVVWSRCIVFVLVVADAVGALLCHCCNCCTFIFVCLFLGRIRFRQLKPPRSCSSRLNSLLGKLAETASEGALSFYLRRSRQIRERKVFFFFLLLLEGIIFNLPRYSFRGVKSANFFWKMGVKRANFFSKWVWKAPPPGPWKKKFKRQTSP